MSDLSLLEKILVFAIPVIFAITVHETAHGWVASKLGDQTARLQGRLTLNPLKHIDPVGTLLVPGILLLLGNFIFGWAKPVPVNARNLGRPRRDMAWVAIAGPAANLLMLLLWVFLAWVAIHLAGTGQGPALLLFYMSLAGITINTILMVLNLIPLPPLDGSRVLSAFLSPRAAIAYGRLEPWGLLIILLLFVSGILGKYFWPVVEAIRNLALATIGVQ